MFWSDGICVSLLPFFGCAYCFDSGKAVPTQTCYLKVCVQLRSTVCNTVMWWSCHKKTQTPPGCSGGIGSRGWGGSGPILGQGPFLRLNFHSLVSPLTFLAFVLPSSYVSTAGSPATVWPTAPRPTETKRWAAASATAVAPPSTKARGAEPKWTRPWVRTRLAGGRRRSMHAELFYWCRAALSPPGDYPYAKCFICSQTGHLSKSCPDNPKGLYAKGTNARKLSLGQWTSW